MNAIRRDEELDNLHSVYVDQWDWEKVITREQRTMETVEDAVRSIMGALCKTQNVLADAFTALERFLPEQISFVTSQQLEDEYPELTPKERENAAAKKYGAVFVSQIGGKLRSGKPHDGRAPDYDDWSLNGDILIWYPVLGRALEISSMGIRVDAAALKRQLETAGCMQRAGLDAAGGPPAADDGRRYRAEPHLHGAAAKGAHRRGAGFRLAGRYARRLRCVGDSSAVIRRYRRLLRRGWDV